MIVKNEDLKLDKLEKKVSRKILSKDGSLMMVEVHFQKGGIGEAHAHEEHEQVCYVAKGSFEVSLGEEKKVLQAGDCFYAKKNKRHAVLALENGILVDVFTPIREDILK